MEIRSQTGLRGLAASIVAVAHMPFEKLMPTLWQKCDLLFYPPTSIGIQAVDLFFMLSGFILSFVYLGSNKPLSWRDFFVARFARIWPLHMATLLILLVPILLMRHSGYIDENSYTFKGFIYQIFLIHSYPGTTIKGWNYPSWSISTEFFCYIFIFPLLAFLFWGVRQIRNFTNLPAICLFVALGVWLALQPVSLGVFYTIRGIAGFSAGFLIYQVYRNSAFWTDLCVKHANIISLVFLITLTVFSVAGWNRFWMLPMLPFLILSFSKDSTTIAHRFLSSRVIYYIGCLSYSIYMLHALVAKAADTVLRNKLVSFLTPDSPVSYIVGLGMILAVFVAAMISYHFFEIPVRKWIRRRFSAPKPGAASP